MSSSSPSPPSQQHPRVGVAMLLLDDRDYILIGKRKGSHGSGTLALPGGHLDMHEESFEACAVRELHEETGIQTTSSSVKFLTAVNSPRMRDASEAGEGKHYVTIFMLGRVARSTGQDEVVARTMEPAKCEGWTWVPLSYLLSRHAAQSSLERYASSAEAQGDTLGVPLHRLLYAERLGQRISGSGSGSGSAEPVAIQGDLNPMSPGATATATTSDEATHPHDDEEMAAYALADDLAGGASFFRPLSDLLQHHGELLRREVSSSSQQQIRSPAASAPSATTPTPTPHLPHSILSDDATTIINAALKAPPHLKHHLTITIPAPTPHHAEEIVAVLKVDKPLRPYDTEITYAANSTLVFVEVKASTVRLLRLSVNAILDDVSLVVRTMQAFPGPLRAHEMEAEREAAGQQGDTTTTEVFEQGTIGKVERVNAI